ncbi:hypothetical protein P43SY_000214 [Pythium insidiosum]|uniref:Mechanosensitive ion channel MscS domain-containing protein n=1 Tax=Pythium insidiosum TaxID=114742 RepID=A0AAD5M9V7_PYTIN|nr:hypothetical protein P43SY_000214 [Pythium insidiosum]
MSTIGKDPARGNNNVFPRDTNGSFPSDGSDDQWRVFLGIALFVGSYVFRVEIVRFTLRLFRRAVPNLFVWIKEFEKNLLRPLSWVVFVLLAWFATYVMDLRNLLNMKSTTIPSLIRLLLGIPLVWTVICLCNYVTWGIIRIQGWSRSSREDDDDYSRVLIITEGIGVIKVLVVAAVVSSFMIDGIGEITKFESSQISTVAVIVVELVFVFGGHTWLKNTLGGLIALMDEQIKSGAHVKFLDHQGVVERFFLQCFSLRRYDKALVYIPNGLLLEHAVQIDTKTMDHRAVIHVRLDPSTSSSAMRILIQELDALMTRVFSETGAKRKSKVLGLERRNRGGSYSKSRSFYCGRE